MDPAEPICSTLRDQDMLLGCHEQTLQALEAQFKSMNDCQEEIITKLIKIGVLRSDQVSSTPSSPCPIPTTSALLAVPPSIFESAYPVITSLPRDIFHGELEKCGGFLYQSSLFFACTLHSFPNGAVKISHFVGLLSGRALAWAAAYLSFHLIHLCGRRKLAGCGALLNFFTFIKRSNERSACVVQ